MTTTENVLVINAGIIADASSHAGPHLALSRRTLPNVPLPSIVFQRRSKSRVTSGFAAGIQGTAPLSIG